MKFKKSPLRLILIASLATAAMSTHAQTIDFNLAKGSLTIPVLRAGATSLYDVVLQFGADGRFTPTSYSATPSSVIAPATAASAGTLTFSSFLGNDSANFGWSIAQNVAITGAGASSVMTFTNPAFTVTGAASDAVTFSDNGGQAKADGNVVSYCSAGNQTTFGASEAINKPFQNGHRVFISANLTPVTNLAEISGLSFSAFNCTGTNAKFVLDTVGGAAFTSAAGNNTVSAALFAQLFTETGLQDSNGAGTKLRLYKYSAAGAAKYFILSIDKYSGGGATNVGYVTMLSQD